MWNDIECENNGICSVDNSFWLRVPNFYKNQRMTFLHHQNKRLEHDSFFHVLHNSYHKCFTKENLYVRLNFNDSKSGLPI